MSDPTSSVFLSCVLTYPASHSWYYIRKWVGEFPSVNRGPSRILVLNHFTLYIVLSPPLSLSVSPLHTSCLVLFLQQKPLVPSLFYFFKDFIYLFLGREKERERNVNVRLPLACPHPSPGTWPATQACALTGTLRFTGQHSIH